jgi:hypothetical protein
MGRKKFFGLLLISIVVFFLAFGCAPKHGSETNGGGNNPEHMQQNQETNIKKYGIGAPITIDGATFVVSKVEAKDRIKNKFSGGYYTPENGMFLVVFYTFNGHGSKMGGVNTDMIQIKVNGKYYPPARNVDIATDYAQQNHVSPLSFALWSSKTSKKFLDVYDVPKVKDSIDISFLVRKNGKIVCLADVPVSDLNISVQESKYSYGTAKDWMKLALNEARKWHSDIRLYLIQGSNVSVAESIDFAEGRDTPERLKLAKLNGEALYWDYIFASPSDKNFYYTVEISDGKVVDHKKSEIAALITPYKYMLLPDQLKLDSKDAFTIALNTVKSRPSFDASKGLLIKYLLDYPLQFADKNGKRIPVWHVKITTFSKNYYEISIDADTGKVLHKYIKDK